MADREQDRNFWPGLLIGGLTVFLVTSIMWSTSDDLDGRVLAACINQRGEDLAAYQECIAINEPKTWSRIVELRE